MTPEEIVTSVFARVRAHDPAVAQLYAEDAVLHHDYGHESFHGRAAIEAFYRTVFVRNPQPQVAALFVHLPTVAALLDVEQPDGEKRQVVDVFQVEDGFIREMRVCDGSPG